MCKERHVEFASCSAPLVQGRMDRQTGPLPLLFRQVKPRTILTLICMTIAFKELCPGSKSLLYWALHMHRAVTGLSQSWQTKALAPRPCLT